MAGQLATRQEEENLEMRLQERVNSIQIVKVVDAETHQKAGELWKEITAAEKEVKAYWDKLTDGAHKVWKGLVSKRDAMLDPLAAKKKEQTDSAKAWVAQEERKRRELELKAQEAARKQAEDDALAAAAALEKEGRKEEAEAVIGSPVETPAVVVQSTVPKGLGGMTRTTWSAEVTDMKALADHVSKTGEIGLILANMTALNFLARGLKSGMNIPGVRAVEK